jgi:hypothetical protein
MLLDHRQAGQQSHLRQCLACVQQHSGSQLRIALCWLGMHVHAGAPHLHQQLLLPLVLLHLLSLSGSV